MTESSFGGKTLREKITEAEKMVRELEDHLENGFITKVKSLRRSVKDFNPESGSSTADTVVRDNASKVVASERFTANLCKRIDPILDSITEDLSIIVEGK